MLGSHLHSSKVRTKAGGSQILQRLPQCRGPGKSGFVGGVLSQLLFSATRGSVCWGELHVDVGTVASVLPAKPAPPKWGCSWGTGPADPAGRKGAPQGASGQARGRGAHWSESQSLAEHTGQQPTFSPAGTVPQHCGGIRVAGTRATRGGEGFSVFYLGLLFLIARTLEQVHLVQNENLAMLF